MALKTQTGEKLAHRFQAHTALETKWIERGHDQAGSPTPTVLRFPQPRLRLAVSERHGLPKTMYATLGEARVLGYASHTLLAVGTKILENQQAFVPKSPVGLSSDGYLNSCRNAVPQRT